MRGAATAVLHVDDGALDYSKCGIGAAVVEWQMQPVELNQLASALVALGCPEDKSSEMAAQLDKRARQLAQLKGRTYEQALQHLLELLRQGWAAKAKEF